MKFKIFTIYALVDPRNGNFFYVGKTSKKQLNTRRGQHVRAARCGQKGEVLDYIRQLLPTIPLIVFLERKNCDIEKMESNALERFWITKIKSEGYQLTNISLPDPYTKRRKKNYKISKT